MADVEVLIDISEIDEMLSGMEKQLSGDKDAVKAGYFEGKKYPNGFELALNALVQEYGTIDNDGFIPPRPFLSLAIEKNEAKWLRIFEGELDKGRTKEQALARVGEEMKNDIKRQIDTNIPPPKKESTIKREGKGKTHTLINTGTLKRSTAAEVFKNDGT